MLNKEEYDKKIIDLEKTIKEHVDFLENLEPHTDRKSADKIRKFLERMGIWKPINKNQLKLELKHE